jgi:class 3 adenylate cyclase
VLERIAAELATSGWAAELVDARWVIRWQSPEFLLITGVDNPREAGLGEHLLASRRRAALDISPPASSARWVRASLPYMAHDDAAAAQSAVAQLPEEIRSRLGALPSPRVPPPVWSADIEVRNGAYVGHARSAFVRLHDADSRLEGTLVLWFPALPATVLALLARGDRAYYRRLARIATPGRRCAAILFADLEGSTELSRSLASEEYFARLAELTTAVDHALVAAGGVVGKHAGDGAVAFFVTDDFGSAEEAVRAAAGAAQALGPAVNVGLHFSDDLYMGQVVTDGRLEVTALGLQVNECARIQESAHGGEILASRAFAERAGLDDGDFGPLGERPGASEKARRDAADLEVTALRAATRSPGNGP